MFEFTGTLEGPDDLDLVALSGLTLSDAERNALWGSTNSRSLLRECPSLDEFEDGGFDERPGQSDIYFKYSISSREQLGVELKVAIEALIGRKRAQK
jgi:hypothetical protein